MRVLAQRVSEASVTVGTEVVGQIGAGLLLLIGMGEEDSTDDGAALAAMATKVLNLRIFPDAEHNMNASLLDVGGAVLAVSQFTLHADCRRGRRPGFSRAAPPMQAREMFDRFVELLKAGGVKVETGRFGAMMQVALVNDGPVTLWLDSREILSG
jgi:D-tyrosyl-tRNA(Tyr) deacylase